MEVKQCNRLYSTAEIQDQKVFYAPGDSFTLRYGTQHKYAMIKDDRIVFRFIPRYATAGEAQRLLIPNWDVSSLFEVSRCEMDGINMIPASSHTARPLYNHIMSFMKNVGSDHANWE